MLSLTNSAVRLRLYASKYLLWKWGTQRPKRIPQKCCHNIFKQITKGPRSGISNEKPCILTSQEVTKLQEDKLEGQKMAVCMYKRAKI